MRAHFLCLYRIDKFKSLDNIETESMRNVKHFWNYKK